LEYDDVMNLQRNKIYNWRRKILFSGGESLREIIKEIFEKTGSDFGAFEKKQKEAPDENEFFHVQAMLLLRVIDMLWVDHIETMEYMRSSVRLRAYGQRDPLVEYKNKALESAIRTYYCQLSLGVQIAPSSEIAPQEIRIPAKPDFSGARHPMPRKEANRNDPCPCGSGKKYKKCHGK
ncbi:MAG: Protein translocase subunit SecA, partial [Candidatus Nomurabacteria bacterium GW2011_GWA1_37_20]